MITLGQLIRRNMKLFFKDKGMFFTSLITPALLLVLYVAFLGKVYRDSIASAFPEGFSVDGSLINGLVGSQLFSSIIAVSCVTIAFCSNLIMVQDKITGANGDFLITPLSRSTRGLAYFIATAAVTMIVILAALCVSMVYLAIVGWYLSFGDIMLLILDSLILVLFGTALSSIVNFPLSTNGQASAVGTIVSAGYGFICGAYMPISAFGVALQRILGFFPGTYGTSLIRNHAMRGALAEMSAQGVPTEVIEGIKDSIDANVYFFGNSVSIGSMYLIMTLSVAALIGIYVLIQYLGRKKRRSVRGGLPKTNL